MEAVIREGGSLPQVRSASRNQQRSGESTKGRKWEKQLRSEMRRWRRRKWPHLKPLAHPAISAEQLLAVIAPQPRPLLLLMWGVVCILPWRGWESSRARGVTHLGGRNSQGRSQGTRVWPLGRP
ncbi:trans-acting factor [Avian leukosis virus]|uniref:Putative trans-acting factor n=1 Tax=Avian leukosis virus subgroup A (isolate RSA) TaxID=363745 RepID=VP14_ALVA|nr:trans-acting factor [Avian leukosis virus - RSA]Q04221.1 RecName: Full=Putative trans-acting factor [Avian leukosis virus - RSA]AAA91267.1 trans-acting factor [Avian leukosis virus - RSA]